MIRKIRNWFWGYPEWLFFGDRSFFAFLKAIYKAGAPFTIGIVISLILGAGIYLVIQEARTLIYGGTDTLMEGVVVGIDPNNPTKMVQVDKISPLTSDSNKTSLEKDLIELIYQSLITVDQQGNVKPVMADVLEVEKGKKYRFKLESGLLWQDGQPVTVDDVIATFNLLKKLNTNPASSTIYSQAAVQMDINKVEGDPLSFEFVVKGDNVIPGLFEALSFKILPAHLIKDITPDNVNLPDPYINRFPVGTGPYKLANRTDEYMDLVANPTFHGGKPSIQTIRFKYFSNNDSALKAIETGQIHALVSSSYSDLNEIGSYTNLAIAKTDVTYTQYMAIYFNLGDNSNPTLMDATVRQAISYAINKQGLIDNVLGGYGVPAYGPIPPISFAYSPVYNHYFNVATAKSLLESAGWKETVAGGIRSKNATQLSFKLYILDNPDRIALANLIKQQLLEVGVDMQIVTENASDLKDILTIRNFDSILYGTETFVDPDRYELYDSSQISSTGLNFSSWSSSDKTETIVNHKVVNVPGSDHDLETARRIIDESDRQKLYKDFQRLMANDTPIIFLFYPQQAYFYSKRITNIDLSGVSSINDRFTNIDQWKFE